jgi:hypothetical protein
MVAGGTKRKLRLREEPDWTFEAASAATDIQRDLERLRPRREPNGSNAMLSGFAARPGEWKGRLVVLSDLETRRIGCLVQPGLGTTGSTQ